MSIQMREYRNPNNSNLPLRVAKGHFATSHSHINYYVDLTMTKYCLPEAREAAIHLANRFKATTLVDTILCLDGTEVIGACMASELTKQSFTSMNANRPICVVTPEHTTGSQLLFRDNTAPMIRDRKVLILAASVSTGYTALGAVEAIRYYGGEPVGICAILANMKECAGIPVVGICDTIHLWEDYASLPAHECPQCKKGIKLDAMVNTYGFSSF